MLRALSERRRKIPSRISGAFERSSITTNEPSSAIASAPRPIVLPEPQPYACALTIAVDEHEQAGRHRDGAGDVGRVGPLLRRASSRS